MFSSICASPLLIGVPQTPAVTANAKSTHWNSVVLPAKLLPFFAQYSMRANAASGYGGARSAIGFCMHA